MNEREILESAGERIERVRKGIARIRVLDSLGKPVPGARVVIEQRNHAFLFGCNIFSLLEYEDSGKPAYGELFAGLLNYATLAFYLGSFEYEKGKPNTVANRRIAQWCADRGIATKGHPLAWHEVYPKWGPADADGAVAMFRERIERDVAGFKGLVDRWDVVNEVIVSERFENGMGAWAKRDGALRVVVEAMKWARKANPGASLLYNDYEISPKFEKLIGELEASGAAPDAYGIQSHMHQGEWTIEKAWEVCETYARFGKPLHFTELTVLSGEHGWRLPPPPNPGPWPSTPEGEAKQADYVEKFYSTLFSHPAVEAITWWDFADGCWQGAPAGLIRADLTRKPAYDRLASLIRGRWWTRGEGQADDAGACQIRGFAGDYAVRVDAGGLSWETTCVLPRSGADWLLRAPASKTARGNGRIKP